MTFPSRVVLEPLLCVSLPVLRADKSDDTNQAMVGLLARAEVLGDRPDPDQAIDHHAPAPDPGYNSARPRHHHSPNRLYVSLGRYGNLCAHIPVLARRTLLETAHQRTLYPPSSGVVYVHRGAVTGRGCGVVAVTLGGCMAVEAGSAAEDTTDTFVFRGDTVCTPFPGFVHQLISQSTNTSTESAFSA